MDVKEKNTQFYLKYTNVISQIVSTDVYLWSAGTYEDVSALYASFDSVEPERTEYLSAKFDLSGPRNSFTIKSFDEYLTISSDNYAVFAKDGDSSGWNADGESSYGRDRGEDPSVEWASSTTLSYYDDKLYVNNNNSTNLTGYLTEDTLSGLDNYGTTLASYTFAKHLKWNSDSNDSLDIEFVKIENKYDTNQITTTVLDPWRESTINITVINVNDPPVAKDFVRTIYQASTFEIDLSENVILDTGDAGKYGLDVSGNINNNNIVISSDYHSIPSGNGTLLVLNATSVVGVSNSSASNDGNNVNIQYYDVEEAAKRIIGSSITSSDLASSEDDVFIYFTNYDGDIYFNTGLDYKVKEGDSFEKYILGFTIEVECNENFTISIEEGDFLWNVVGGVDSTYYDSNNNNFSFTVDKDKSDTDNSYSETPNYWTYNFSKYNSKYNLSFRLNKNNNDTNTANPTYADALDGYYGDTNYVSDNDIVYEGKLCNISSIAPITVSITNTVFGQAIDNSSTEFKIYQIPQEQIDNPTDSNGLELNVIPTDSSGLESQMPYTGGCVIYMTTSGEVFYNTTESIDTMSFTVNGALQSLVFDQDSSGLIIESSPTDGTLTIEKTKLTYTHKNYSVSPTSPISFSYTVKDDENLNDTKNITFNIIESVPIANDVLGINLPSDETSIEIDLSSSVQIMNDNGIYIDGSGLTFILVDTLNGVSLNGSVFSFKRTLSNLDLYGKQSFNYKVKDGELESAEATVEITLGYVPSDYTIKQAVGVWMMDSNNADNIYGPMSNWETGYVTNMSELFKNASEFNEDISSWDTSSVTDMSLMFYGANEFNQDLSNWDVSSVRNFREMYIHTLYDIFSWDVNNADANDLQDMNLYGSDSNNNNKYSPFSTTLAIPGPAWRLEVVFVISVLEVDYWG